jgi:hypothetical protein
MSTSKYIHALPDIDPSTALAQAAWHGPDRCLALDESPDGLPPVTAELRSAPVIPKWRDNPGAFLWSWLAGFL